jgi:hypothetical protein
MPRSPRSGMGLFFAKPATEACASAYLCPDRLYRWLHRQHPAAPGDRIG